MNCFRVFGRIMVIHVFGDAYRTGVPSMVLAWSLQSAPTGFLQLANSRLRAAVAFKG
jgi:hypothetical protein